ncbi:MAG: phosphoglycerate mutase [Moraxellaceae bacterium]|jgi:broad specificity phosphatase PhoE|nr:phosphoglycerate mutase [Moraxellaceae bacterium]
MAKLHPALAPAMALLPGDRPLTLLTRHSVREMAPNGIATYDLPLTEEGVRLAEEWGGQLPWPLHGLHSSPIGRCMDTASAMARGAGCGELEIRTSPNLVEPGCYVHSIGRVGPLFLELGPLAFANRHFSGPLEGILSPEQGGAKLLRHLYEHQGPAGTLTVHVTHDTILAAFIYHLMERGPLRDEDWPWMMEGAWLWFDDADTVRWVWRGEPGRRNIAPYRAHAGN